jgi:hypothetical protein
MKTSDAFRVDGSLEFNQTHWIPQTAAERVEEPVFPVKAPAPKLPDFYLVLKGQTFEVRRFEGQEVIASTPNYRAARAAMRLLGGES